MAAPSTNTSDFRRAHTDLVRSTFGMTRRPDVSMVFMALSLPPQMASHYHSDPPLGTHPRHRGDVVRHPQTQGDVVGHPKIE